MEITFIELIAKNLDVADERSFAYNVWSTNMSSLFSGAPNMQAKPDELSKCLGLSELFIGYSVMYLNERYA